jgi:hypothetical protein
MPKTLLPMDVNKSPKFALTYWNRIEPRPRTSEIKDTLAARVRDPLWMLTRQWQFGEFHGEDAGSPAFVQLNTSTANVIGWRPSGTQQLATIDAPLEQLVATEGCTPDLGTRVELGQLFAQRLASQGVTKAIVREILDAFRTDYPIDATDISPKDVDAHRLLAVCIDRTVDGAALAHAHSLGTSLPLVQVVNDNSVAVRAALDQLLEDVEATLGTVDSSDAPAWHADQLEYQAEVVTALPGGGAVILGANPSRDATFEWYAFDVLGEVVLPQAYEEKPSVLSISYLPTHVRFRGMPNPRWWDFERGVTDFGAVTPDKRDLAKLMMMDFMLIHSNDYFVIPFDLQIGKMCQIDRLLVHDVFGGITLVNRADSQESDFPSRWTCFSLARTDRGGAPAGVFFLPPSAGVARISGDAIEDVRFVRDEQANYVWAIEHSTEGGNGHPWLGHERSVVESADEPVPAPPVTDAVLRYELQSFVPRHWFPLLPVSLDALSGETAFEVGRMVRPDGTMPEPYGRVLRPQGTQEYRVREEAIPRVGVRVLREPVRTRWTQGATHFWLARRRLVGRGEGASGLCYDQAIISPPKSKP